MTKRFPQLLANALKAVRRKSASRPKTGIILGSGLSDLASRFGGKAIGFPDIPGFPAPTVAGHAGVFYLGDEVAIMAGRFHLYEGVGVDTVLLPVALLHALGVQALILTNAAGSLRPELGPGSLSLISDHINFMGDNPLSGPHLAAFGPRFPDMSAVYTAQLREKARQLDSSLPEGVYLAVRGPSYETPAEIRAFKTLGADMVGMSTVPEAIFARSLGMEILGVSLLTNLASGLGTPLNHEEVMAAGKLAGHRLGALLESFVRL